MRGCNFTDINGACMPSSLATTRNQQKLLDLRLDAGAKPALMNKLPFGGLYSLHHIL
jgi:hypothetical protein